jgi:hypothetical protein
MEKKIKLKIINNLYPLYGILPVEYVKDIIINDNEEYIKLYNKCVFDIIKYIYQGQTKCIDNILYLTLDENIIELTRLDLHFIKSLNKKLNEKKIYGNLEKYYDKTIFPLPNSNTETNVFSNKSYPTTNYEFFKYEDFDMINWNVYYKYISSEYEKYFNKNYIKYNVIEEQVMNFSTLILELKLEFNRLRPYQSSLIENINIETYNTYAGQTPALPSGHSLQGFLFGAFIYFHFKELFELYKKNYKNKFVQEIILLVDVSKDPGHRRVMSGIHYFSDTISSWIVFRNIINTLKIRSHIKPYYKYLKNRFCEF